MDDYLVQSIVQPTQDANAGEVYYRLVCELAKRWVTTVFCYKLSHLILSSSKEHPPLRPPGILGVLEPENAHITCWI